MGDCARERRVSSVLGDRVNSDVAYSAKMKKPIFLRHSVHCDKLQRRLDKYLGDAVTAILRSLPRRRGSHAR